MEKIIKIGDREVGFKATASTTRRYRQRFGSDLFVDMGKLIVNAQNQLTAGDLECFENIAYTMAKQYDPSIPEDPDDWLDEFPMFSIYEILPQIIELWGLENMTLANSKKKADQLNGR